MGAEMFSFDPDFLISPCETLLETIQELDISQAELAKRTGRPLKRLME